MRRPPRPADVGTGLPGGTYQLQFSHIDSTADTITFGIDCDKTC